jgi:hypothetical protein
MKSLLEKKSTSKYPKKFLLRGKKKGEPHEIVDAKEN